MPILRTDQAHKKGDTYELRGTSRREGILRRFAEKEDLLEFSISTDFNIPGIITKTTAAGIEVDDSGNWIVTIPKDEIERDDLPADEYVYALRTTEGDTGNRYTLVRGVLNLEDVPFSTN
jgi:hypothetical protein